MSSDRTIGPISAYGIAKANGYTGTEAEFANQIANAAQNAQTASNAAETATQAAQTATQKADSIPASFPELTSQVEFLTDENYTVQSGADVYEIGGINYSSGSLTNATVRFRTKDYLDGSIGIRANDGYKFIVFAYRKTANIQYLGAWTGTGFSTNANDAKIVTGSVALSSLGDYYYKVVGMRPNVSEDVTTEDFDKVEILYSTKATNADRDALGIALGNANDFAVTNYANSAKGKQDGYSYLVNNYTVIGTTNASICVSGSPNVKPSNASFSSLPDDYYTIPLIAGKTYTLVAFVTGQTGVGNISFYLANKTDKAEIVQCTYNIVPADVHDKIVMNNFTVPTDDMYALKVYIRSQENKVVKVAIYPQDCLYQRIAALNTSLTGVQTSIGTLSAKDTEIEAEIDTLSAQMETAGKLESTGDSTDRTAEIRAKLTANGYCELGDGEFVVANLEMPAGTELRGQGYATVLKLDTSLTSGAAVVAKNRCTVRDLAITGAESLVINSDSTAGNRHGIKIDAYLDIDVRISNVRINSFDGYGIYVRGFGMSTSVIKYVQCNVSDCFIDHCFTGIYVGGLANNAMFTNCHCVNGYYAVYATTRCQFADCVFMNNLMGVYVVGKGPSFIGCTFHDEGSTVNTYALVAQNVTQFPMTLTGCRFYGCGALEITGTSGSSVALMALFSGCAFGGMTLPIVCNYAAGILFDGCLFGEDVTASGNISESSTGLVKLKNCYRTTTGALLER